jgi:C2 domain
MSDVKQKGCITGNFLLEPYGSISAKICWIELTDDKLAYMKTENCSLLQVYIDSGRSIKAKFLPLVAISINNQSKQTQSAHVNREMASWRKHFNFFVENVEEDNLTLTLIDQQSLQDIGSYVYKIKDLVLRKGMEHELQAFPLNSVYNSEIIMALKLNSLISPE